MNKSLNIGPMSPNFFPFHRDHVLVTDFNVDATAIFMHEFRELEKDPSVPIIPVYIHSYGGDAHSLLAMRDIIKSSHKPVATIAIGMAMSCGVLLLAAGTKGYRFAAPSTQIMIHEASWQHYGKASDITEGARSFERLNKMVYVNFSKDTGLSVSKLEKKMRDIKNADWYLDAKEALKLGIIDVIELPRVLEQPPHSVIAKMDSYDQMKKMSERQEPKRKR